MNPLSFTIAQKTGWKLAFIFPSETKQQQQKTTPAQLILMTFGCLRVNYWVYKSSLVTLLPPAHLLILLLLHICTWVCFCQTTCSLSHERSVCLHLCCCFPSLLNCTLLFPSADPLKIKPLQSHQLVALVHPCLSRTPHGTCEIALLTGLPLKLLFSIQLSLFPSTKKIIH